MSKNDQRGRAAARLTPVHGLLAAAILALAVTPIAFAGASGPEATASATLTQKVKKLKQRVAALEAKGGATGNAGGDLTGTYPNPQIGPDKVGSAEIANDAVGSSEVAPDSLAGIDIANNAITSGEIAAGAVGANEIGSNMTARAADVSVANGQTRSQTAGCLGGEQIVSGGAFWVTGIADDADLSVVEIQVLTGTEQVVARGQNDSGATETFQVQAYCMT